MSKPIHIVSLYFDGTYGTNLSKTEVPGDPITQGIHGQLMYKKTNAIRSFFENLSPGIPKKYFSGPGTDIMHAKEKSIFGKLWSAGVSVLGGLFGDVGAHSVAANLKAAKAFLTDEVKGVAKNGEFVIHLNGWSRGGATVNYLIAAIRSDTDDKDLREFKKYVQENNIKLKIFAKGIDPVPGSSIDRKNISKIKNNENLDCTVTSRSYLSHTGNIELWDVTIGRLTDVNLPCFSFYSDPALAKEGHKSVMLNSTHDGIAGHIDTTNPKKLAVMYIVQADMLVNSFKEGLVFNLDWAQEIIANALKYGKNYNPDAEIAPVSRKKLDGENPHFGVDSDIPYFAQEDLDDLMDELNILNEKIELKKCFDGVKNENSDKMAKLGVTRTSKEIEFSFSDSIDKSKKKIEVLTRENLIFSGLENIKNIEDLIYSTAHDKLFDNNTLDLLNNDSSLETSLLFINEIAKTLALPDIRVEKINNLSSANTDENKICTKIKTASLKYLAIKEANKFFEDIETIIRTSSCKEDEKVKASEAAQDLKKEIIYNIKHDKEGSIYKCESYTSFKSLKTMIEGKNDPSIVKNYYLSLKEKQGEIKNYSLRKMLYNFLNSATKFLGITPPSTSKPVIFSSIFSKKEEAVYKEVNFLESLKPSMPSLRPGA